MAGYYDIGRLFLEGTQQLTPKSRAAPHVRLGGRWERGVGNDRAVGVRPWVPPYFDRQLAGSPGWCLAWLEAHQGFSPRLFHLCDANLAFTVSGVGFYS